MTDTADLLTHSTDHWLEFTDRDWSVALQQSDRLSPPGIARQAALNRLAIALLQEWLSEELTLNLSLWPNPQQAECLWTVVNGVAWQAGDFRLVAIVSNGMVVNGVSADFSVPQEWVDSPTWVADYYLAVQVDVDDRALGIAGYCTHTDLKTSGRYDPDDRTYHLAAEQLTDDIYTLFMLREAGLAGETRAAVSPIPDIAPAQSQNLLDRLSDREIPFPRLEYPFALWAACVNNLQWVQQLYERRQDTAPRLVSRAVNLGAWVRGLADTFAADWQDAMPRSELAFREGETTKEKLIRVGRDSYILSVDISPLDAGGMAVAASVRSANLDRPLPAGFRFDLCDRAGDIICPSPSLQPDDYRISQELDIEPGDTFCLRISLDGDRHDEWFELA